MILKLSGATCFLVARYFGIVYWKATPEWEKPQNPTVSEFVKNTENFCIMSAIWVGMVTENCRGVNVK